MKEKILEYLRNSETVKKSGCSERTMEVYVDTQVKMPETEEGLTPEFYAPIEAGCAAWGGQINRLAAEAVRPRKQETGLDAKAIADAVASAMAPITEKMSLMEKRFSDMDSREKTARLLGEARNLVESRYRPNEKRKAMVDDSFSFVTSSLPENATAESIAESWKARYDKMLEMSALTDGYAPAEGNGGGTSQTAALLKEIVKKQADAGAANKSVQDFLGLGQNKD